MAGSSALLLASSIGLDPCLELLIGAESDDASRTDRDLFARLGIAARALVLVAQVEIAEAGELHLLALGERGAHFLEEHVDELARLALVEPELIEERFGHLGFRECHRY